MTDSRQPEKLLSQAVAERLLARASELDAVHTSIAELRAAAAEAGISAQAFDAALAEVQKEIPPESQPPAPRRRRWVGIAVGAGGALIAMIAFATVIIPTRAATPVLPFVDLPINSPCILPEQAADVARPFLGDGGSIVASQGGVLRVRATAVQIDQIRAALKDFEARSPSCAHKATTKRR